MGILGRTSLAEGMVSAKVLRRELRLQKPVQGAGLEDMECMVYVQSFICVSQGAITIAWRSDGLLCVS